MAAGHRRHDGCRPCLTLSINRETRLEGLYKKAGMSPRVYQSSLYKMALVPEARIVPGDNAPKRCPACLRPWPEPFALR